MYACHWCDVWGAGAAVCGGTAASCVPGGTNYTTEKLIWLGCRPDSGAPTSFTNVNFTAGFAAAGAAGMVTLSIMAVMDWAVLTLSAVMGPVAPGGPDGPAAP